MKLMIQKATGLDEQSIVETEQWDDWLKAYELLDARLATTNNKIVAAREFVEAVKDPHYRYMFTSFLDSFLGISSNAESLQKKFGVQRPPDYDAWYKLSESKATAKVYKLDLPQPVK